MQAVCPADLEDLRAQVRTLEQTDRKSVGVLPFEVAALDAVLPGGGSLWAHCTKWPAAETTLWAALRRRCSRRESSPACPDKCCGASPDRTCSPPHSATPGSIQIGSSMSRPGTRSL